MNLWKYNFEKRWFSFSKLNFAGKNKVCRRRDKPRKYNFARKKYNYNLFLSFYKLYSNESERYDLKKKGFFSKFYLSSVKLSIWIAHLAIWIPKNIHRQEIIYILSVTSLLYCNNKPFVIQINRLCWILFDDARQRNVFSCSTISRFAREQNGIRKWSFRVKMSKWRSSANSDERKTI